ncbi:MAG: GNAT family N-acetyltransferase [Thermoplasmata archaeon]|nr:GNAT family N-acetyltransferase [Thermoplasmata archaeon]
MTEEPQVERGLSPGTSLRRVNWAEDLPRVRPLFQAYRGWLADHQDPEPSGRSRAGAGLALVDDLIAKLPGAYGPPRGDVLLWFLDGEIVACGALREVELGIGEIKRISVAPDYRGMEFGRPFVRSLIARARELGFGRLRVDTLPTMRAAIEFYQEAGFKPIPAYWANPVAGALFFELGL